MATPLDLSRRFPGFDTVATPAAVIDVIGLRTNIATMQAHVDGRAALHPHVKTHKSRLIAGMQRAGGAAGFTVARANEAAMLLDAGLGPVTLAQPLVSPLVAAGLVGAFVARSLRFIADSPATVAAAAGAAAATADAPVAVFLKVNVGLNRCGVEPDGDAALSVVEAIRRDGRLRFAGLLSHAGHAYGAGTPEGVRQVAAEEKARLFRVRDRLGAAGIEVPAISIGSTPTLLADAGFDGIDEVRPGNYVFYDLAAVRLGLVTRNDVALGIAATVISTNSRYSIVNAGSKTLSSDLGAHGTGVAGYGEAWARGRDTAIPVVRLSEEHGFLDTSSDPLPLGTPVVILPNHSCPVANLAHRLIGLGGDGEVFLNDAPSGH